MKKMIVSAFVSSLILSGLGSVPVGVCLVVDAVRRTELECALEFLVAAGRDYYARTCRSGELQNKKRDPTGALHKNCLARLKIATLEEGAPGGERCDGQRCGFGIAQVGRR